MCGIIGYIGKNDCTDVLIEGLKRLEYRGYDSAGIAVINSHEINVVKQKGKIKNLEDALFSTPLSGALGIGHTRWATHGVPSYENAHPHLDCEKKIAVVHNGIIENFQELKDELIKEGHKFTSETDTEVIVHLIEKNYKNTNSLLLAVKETLQKIEGAYALGIISLLEPDKIIAVRQGSPLIIGVGKEESFIASDIPAILNYTKEVIYLDDNEIAILSRDNITIIDQEGKEKAKEKTTITWDTKSAEKCGYSHFMLKEIYEQGKAIKDTLRGRITKDKKSIYFSDLNISSADLKNVKEIFIVACGTAYYAGYTGKYFIEEIVKIPVEIDIASEFRYRNVPVDNSSLVLAISQSGETADTLASVREAKRKGAKILSICNVVGSSLSRESDGVIYTYAGPEICVASTKAYTSQIVTIYLFALYFAEVLNRLSLEEMSDYLQELWKIPSLVEKILKDTSEPMKRYAEELSGARSVLYLGRNINFPNALEGALKLKEISYIHAEGYAAGEMKHGPIALIDEGLPVVCLAPKSKTYEKIISNIQEVKARRGKVFAVATEGDEGIKKYCDEVIYIPEINELFSPVLTVIPLQLLAYYTALKRNCDIDQPRNLAKSVTVE